MKDTGFKLVLKEKAYCFLKWGQYMKRANVAERKLEKLKALVLLVDPVVSDVQMNDVTTKQWLEFVKCLPEEAQ